MARNGEPDFWVKDKKKSLGDSFNRITSYGVPKQEKPVGANTPQREAPSASNSSNLSNSYIRLEQIDHATNHLSYSEFLGQLTKHGSPLASQAVDAMDLFIRCLKPNVQVSCEFNSILRSGYIELARSESTVSASNSYCNDTDSINGRAILIDKKVSFEVGYEQNFLVIKNITGLKIAMDVLSQVFKAEIKTVCFRKFEQSDYIQIIKAENPIHKIKPDMPNQLTFVNVTSS